MSLVLMNKALAETFSPEVNTGMPSLMFYVDDIEKLFERYKTAGVKVNGISSMGSMKNNAAVIAGTPVSEQAWEINWSVQER